MNWMVILPILLKWLDRLGDWIDNISTAVKQKAKIEDVNKIDNAIVNADDQHIIDELRKLITKIEDRKKLN